MLTKGAIGNLVNRYRAVLTKCNLINTFGSLAVAAALVLGGAGVAGAEVKILNEDVEINRIYKYKEYNYELNQSEYKSIYSEYFDCDLNGNSLIVTASDAIAVDNTLANTNVETMKVSIGKDPNSGYVKITSNMNGLKLCNFNDEDHSIKAKDIYIESVNNEAVYINLDTKLNIEGQNITIKSSSSAWNSLMVYGNLKISGDNVNIESKSWTAIRAANANIEITAKELTLKTGSTEEYANRADRKDHAAIASEEGATFKFNVEKATFNGNAYFDGPAEMKGSFNLNGKENEFTEIEEGSDVEFVLSNADTKVAIKENNADNLGVTGSEELTNEYGGDINKLAEQVTIEKGSEGTTLKLNESGIYGETTAELAADGKVDKDTIKQKKNELMDAALQQASVTMVSLDKILTNDVRKRLGDIRADQNKTGVWMRWDGGKLKGDSGLTNNFNTIQIGGDTKAAKNCRIGFAGSFTHGDTEFSRGNGELEGFSFALYGTWMGENGMFADVVARLGKFSTEMNVSGNQGDIDNRVASLSAEYGWRLPVCGQFFVEPQVELAYTYVSSDDLQLGDNHYEFDSVDSLTGRAGVVFGWNLPDERGNVYARASVLQQFMGDAKISGTNGDAHNIQEIDGDDTWLEYGIGANVKLTDSTYLWADVERTEGADIEEEWRGTVGIRYSF